MGDLGIGIRSSPVNEITAKGLGLAVRTRGARNAYAILSDVSLRLPRGSVIGVLGESGSGKSTLARLMVGLERPSTGSIRYNDTDLWSVSANDRRTRVGRHVSMVFQDPRSSVNPRLRIADVVADPLVVHAVGTRASRRERVEQLIGDVGLSKETSMRRAEQLSGGQLQRAAIARSLALEPDFIFADEPTSALDVSVQAQVLNLLIELYQRHRFGMMLISHDIRVVRHMADVTAVMYLGSVVELGPTAAVFDAPLHPYTRALLSSAPRVEARGRGRVVPIRGIAPHPSRRPAGCAFHTRCWKATQECRGGEVPTAGDDSHWALCHYPE